MLLTRPIRKQATQSVILVEQFKRVYELTNFTLPSVQFWLGYISSYASQRCPISNKIFTIDDWKQLGQTINMAMLASFDQVIKTENVYELIIYAVSSQISVKEGGANIKKITQCIRKYLEELALDTRYLKNRYFNASQNKIEPRAHSYEKKQKKFVQPPNKIQENEENIGLGIQCPICVQQITLSTVCPISCGHNLHKACFLQHFKNKVQNKKFPITCPQQGCGIEIVIQDLQEYIPKEQLEKYYEFSLHQFVDKNNKNTNWCPTPGCSAVFSYDGQVLTYKCMGCQKEYCLKCKTESHVGYTCQRNKQMLNLPEEQKEFINFAKGAHMKQCPSCKFWVEKNKGCDHMTCRCGYQFCFRCGAKYGEGQCSCDQNDSFYGNDDDDDSDGDDSGINQYPPQEQEQDQEIFRDRLDRINPPRDLREPIILGRGRGRERGIQRNIFNIFGRDNGIRIGGDQRREIPNIHIHRGYLQKQQSPMEDAYQDQQMSNFSGSSFERKL